MTSFIPLSKLLQVFTLFQIVYFFICFCIAWAAVSVIRLAEIIENSSGGASGALTKPYSWAYNNPDDIEIVNAAEEKEYRPTIPNYILVSPIVYVGACTQGWACCTFGCTCNTCG
ncbi:hypothetical protein AX774_g1558 [Zancudomyces culisetae]|uniref:Uncharacterized protein n=1 Tax=Zancudomyces culisetae TaxID=1213189 RepID=A0A1R1PVD4_ZANCU|nr:hypothetical protein AX774_g1558 [Zancudomyces culisetae]|eukprot:OMH84903.1 hypothetical protein AX774_g1558 [Zancudomyces culisetae]